MTLLQTVCQSIIDEYGDRLERISRQLDGLSDSGSDFAEDLRKLKSMYAAIVVEALKYVSDDVRMARTSIVGGHCDRVVRELIEAC